MKKELVIGDVTWIHLIEPTKKEIAALEEKYELHELIVEYLTEVNTQHVINQYDDHILVVFLFPKFQPNVWKYVLNEFTIILGKDYVITTTRFETNTVQKIMKEYQDELEEREADENFKISPYYILYKIIDVLYDKMIIGLHKTSKELLFIEESVMLSKNLSKNILEQLMTKKLNMAHVKYTFQPQEEILDELNEAVQKFYEGDLEVYFGDLQSKQKKIMTTSWFLFDTVNSLTDTYDGLMNIQTNGIIKTLTILTAMMWLFTLITWFYGMNMSVPLGGHPLWYLIVIGWMVIFGGLMAAVFRKKGRI